MFKPVFSATYNPKKTAILSTVLNAYVFGFDFMSCKGFKRLFLLISLVVITGFCKPVLAEERVVRVGVFDFPPAIYQDESGQFTGMFVDLLEEVARRENIRFEYVFGSWKEGLDRIRSGEIDLMTSVAFTDERATYMDYAKTPLLTVWAELYVHKNTDFNSENIIRWLNGKDVAVMQNDFNGASFKSMIRRFNSHCEYLEVRDFKSVLAAVSAGEADAGVISVLAAAVDVPDYEVKATGLVFNPFDIYLTVPKGQQAELLTILDSYLGRWREQSDSPYYAAHDKWFHEHVRKVEVAPSWLPLVGWLVLAGFLFFLFFVFVLRRQVSRATAHLLAGEAHFRKAVSEAPIPIMLYNDNGDILALSRAWLAGSHYDATTLKAVEDWVKRAFPAESEHFLAEMQRVFKESEHTFANDAVIRCHDGSERIWAFQYQALGYIPGGDRIALCIAVDETDRILREQELRKSEERFRLLFEQMISGFALHEIITDADNSPVDYRFLLVNKAFEELTGLSAEDVIGKTVKDVMPDIEDYWLERYAKVAITGKPCEFDSYASALQKHFMVRAYSHRAGQFATIFTDMTERKRIERERQDVIKQLEAKNEELERIAYTISHDLKSPLVTVSGFAGQLETDLKTGKLETALVDVGYIKAAAAKMKNLITELLDYTRLGYVDEKRVPVLLSDIIAEVLEPFMGDIAKLSFEVVRPRSDVLLHAVPGRMVELWQNLVDNAIKYRAEKGPRCLEIGFEGSGPSTEFYIRDNGVGFDEAYREKIFKIFEKLDPEVEGTGIGLAIVKRIVNVNEGMIWVEQYDQWTCFRFTLPLAFQGEQMEETHE